MVLYLFLTHSLTNHCRKYLHLTPYQIINANRTRILPSLNLKMLIIYLQTNPSIDATHGNRLPNARKCEKCTTTLLPDTAPFKSSHRHTHNFHLALRSQCCKKLQIITVNRGQQFRQRGWLRGWEGVERLEVCYEGAEEEGYGQRPGPLVEGGKGGMDDFDKELHDSHEWLNTNSKKKKLSSVTFLSRWSFRVARGSNWSRKLWMDNQQKTYYCLGMNSNM